jgi:hypothetical protein
MGALGTRGALLFALFTIACANCSDSLGSQIQWTIDGVRKGCLKSFCNDTVFSAYSNRYCPATCSTCTATTQAPTPPALCYDDDASIQRLAGFPSCRSVAAFCNTSSVVTLCPATCNRCSSASPNAGECFFGCRGDPYLCFLLGFIGKTTTYNTVTTVPCTASCSAGTGRWGGMLTSWHHCLNYTRPIPDDCSILEGGFNLFGVKNSLCTLCAHRNCNDPSLTPTPLALQKLPAKPLSTASNTMVAVLFDIRMVPLSGSRFGAIAGFLQARITGTNEWGSVCADTRWGLNESVVACKQLGLGQAVRAFSTPRSPGPATINSFSCTGFETHLGQCSMSISTLTQQCFTDAALYCTGPLFQEPVRPFPPTSPNISGLLKTIVVDLNNDTLADIVFSSFTAGVIGWHRNLGLGMFDSAQVMALDVLALYTPVQMLFRKCTQRIDHRFVHFMVSDIVEQDFRSWAGCW